MGSLFDCPTVGIPGARQDSLMTRAQGRPKEDDVRPKIVDARSCDPAMLVSAIGTVHLRPSLPYKG